MWLCYLRAVSLEQVTWPLCAAVSSLKDGDNNYTTSNPRILIRLKEVCLEMHLAGCLAPEASINVPKKGGMTEESGGRRPLVASFLAVCPVVARLRQHLLPSLPLSISGWLSFPVGDWPKHERAQNAGTEARLCSGRREFTRARQRSPLSLSSDSTDSGF